MGERKLRRGLWWSKSTRTWHYEIKLDGGHHKGDTGHSRERDARIWLGLKKEAFRRAEVGLLPRGPAPTLAQALEHWLKEWAPRRSARHREIVRSTLELHLAAELPTPITALDTATVNQAVAAYLEAPGHSEGGANVLLRSLSCVVRHEVRAGRIQAMPYSAKLLTVQHRPRRAMTPEDLHRLLETLRDMEAPQAAQDLVSLMAGLGLRSSEARLARVEAFDRARHTFTPWDPQAGTKGREAVACPVPSWLMPGLLRMAGARTTGYLVSAQGGDPPSRMVAWRWVKAARERLGWPWLTPHELRACYATLLSDEGVSPQVIQGLLRHKQLKTTERYLRRNMDTAREALERIAQKARLGPAKSPQSPP